MHSGVAARSREAIQLGERFMSSRIFKRSARAFRGPRIARRRMLPPPEYPRTRVSPGRISTGLETCGSGRKQKCGLLWSVYVQKFYVF
jgi:hypothetical protein